MAVVFPDSQQLALLNSIAGSSGLLYDLTCHLYSNNLQPNNESVLGDFTEVTTEQFPGYVAPSTIQFGSAYLNANGQAQVAAPAATFGPATSTPSVTVYGYYMTATISSTEFLVYSEPLTQGLILSETGQGLTVVPVVTLDDANA